MKKQLTFKDWKAKYYPVEAREVPKKEAIQHSLTKWLGLRPKTLAKYGLEADGIGLYGIGTNKSLFYVDASNCALCYHYWDARDNVDVSPCRRCPLYKVRGASCDSELLGEKRSPCKSFAREPYTPEPMIKLLRQAARKAK